MTDKLTTGRQIVQKSLEKQLNILLELNSTIMSKFLASDWREKFLHSLHHSDVSKKFVEAMEERIHYSTRVQGDIFELIEALKESDKQ